MSSEKSPNLGNLARKIRNLSGIGDETLLEDFQNRRDSKEALSEAELTERIDLIEQNVDQLSYSTALERSMYYAVLERLRLRVEMREGKIDLEDPMDIRDLEVLKDLERRITYAQHEQAAIDEMLDMVTRYEEYRRKYNLDRPVSEGGVIRNYELERGVQQQLEALKELLPQMALVRRIRFYQYRLSLDPTNSGLQDKIRSLVEQLPSDAQDKKIDDYYGELSLQLRKILGTPSKEAANRGMETQRAIELQTDVIQRHFEIVFARRKGLLGRTSPEAEAKKQELKEEHAALINDALEFNFEVVQQRTRLITLLALEGHIHQPVEEPKTAKEPDRDYGLLKDRDALEKERDRHIKMLEEYIRHFRKDVLREDKRIDVPFLDEDIILDPSVIIEDLMTTYVIPAKIQFCEPGARLATAGWSVHDSAWGLIGLDPGIEQKRRDAILQPIYERLGLPENYGQLSEQEKAKAMANSVVQGKLRSVKKIIDDFRANEAKVLDAIEQDLRLLRILLAKKPPSKLVLEGPVSVPESMPNLGTISSDEEYAGAYIFLVERLEGQRMQNLNAVQRKFITQLNSNLNLNIDISDIDMQITFAFIRETLYASGAILAELIMAYLLLRKGVPYIIRKSPAAARGAWRGVTRLGPERLFRGGLAAAQAYRTYLHYQEWKEAVHQQELKKAEIVAKELLSAGFEDADPKNPGESFVYKDGGLEIRVRAQDLTSSQEAHSKAVRTAGSAVEAAYLTGVVFVTSAPIILPMAACEVVIEGVQWGVNRAARRKFVRRCPAWLLAKINLIEETKERPYDVLERESRYLGEEERNVREKMLMSVLFAELKQFSELQAELFGDNTHPVMLDYFFNGADGKGGEFKKVFLPMFQARLYALEGKEISWDRLQESKINTGEVTLIEMRRAMRDAIVFYIQYLREKHYRKALEERDRFATQVRELQDSGKTDRDLEMQLKISEDMVQTLGEEKVFGRKLSELELHSEETQAEIMLNAMLSRLKDERLRNKKEAFVLNPQMIGLEVFSSDLNFAKKSALMQFVDDPVLRTKMERLHPQTEAEPEAGEHIDLDPNVAFIGPVGFMVESVRGLPKGIMTAPSRWEWPWEVQGVEPGESNYLMSLHAANNVIRAVNREAGTEEITELYDSMSSRLRPSSKESSQKLTEAAVMLMKNRVQSSADGKRSFRYAPRTGEKLYKDEHTNYRPSLYKDEHTNYRPMVFSYIDAADAGSIDYERLLQGRRFVSRPKMDEAIFGFEKVKAVFFEGKELGGSRVVLATFVYGNVETFNSEQPEVYAIQRAWATSGLRSCAEGLNHILTTSDFLRQEGSKDMLRMAAERYPKWKAQRDRIDERERQELEKERQRRESLRSKERSLQDQDRELAISNPDVWRIYHSERISEREVPYDHVAYLPPQNGIPGYFLYLQEPELAPKTPTIQAVGDSREGRTIGPREKTRITITTEDGKNLGRFTLRGDYIRALGRGKYARFEGILTQALTLPIPGDDLGSVRKILAVYVEDLDDDEVRSMEEKILKHYNKLQSDQDRGKFLRFLRSNINRETSDEKKPDQWHHLTSKKLGAALSETLRYIGR